MTSFLHDLEEQLRTAAHHRAPGGDAPAPTPPPRGPRRGRRRWGRVAGGARLIAALVAVAVTLAVVIGALVLLGHRGGQPSSAPASGGPGGTLAALIENTPKALLRRELALMSTATRRVQASAQCHGAPQPRIMAKIHHPPGPALLSTLAVLRRPARAADRLPAGAFSQPGRGIAVYVGAARRAAHILGTTYYLVPIRQYPAGDLPSARCFALQSAALDKALPTFPAALRSPVHTLQAALLAYERSLAAKPPVDAVCEVTVQRNGGGMSCSETAAQIRHNLFPDDDNGVFSGLVPDGVASVTLNFPAASGHPARSVTATVHANVYAVATGISGPPRPGAPTVTWRGADGQVVRSYTQPSPAQLRQLCRQQSDGCVAALLVGAAGEVSEGSSSSSASASATTRSQPSPRSATTGG